MSSDWNGLPPDPTWRGFHWLRWDDQEVLCYWEPNTQVWSFGYLGTDAPGLAKTDAVYLEPIPRPSEKVTPLKRKCLTPEAAQSDDRPGGSASSRR
jgi:hypothetical protein